jgi:hypothetical protein
VADHPLVEVLSRLAGSPCGLLQVQKGNLRITLARTGAGSASIG